MMIYLPTTTVQLDLISDFVITETIIRLSKNYCYVYCLLIKATNNVQTTNTKCVELGISHTYDSSLGEGNYGSF